MVRQVSGLASRASGSRQGCLTSYDTESGESASRREVNVYRIYVPLWYLVCMTHGRVRLRPTRFAFLIPYNDKASLLKAVRVNSFLWGGQFNPIVPVFTRPPRGIPKYLSKTIVGESYLQQYLNNFDPDLIVGLGECEDRAFNTSNRETVSYARILSEIETWRIPQYGIGLFEVLAHFASKEARYLQRREKTLRAPLFTGQHSLFLASVFGQLPDEINEIFSRDYLPHFEHETAGC